MPQEPYPTFTVLFTRRTVGPLRFIFLFIVAASQHIAHLYRKNPRRGKTEPKDTEPEEMECSARGNSLVNLSRFYLWKPQNH